MDILSQRSRKSHLAYARDAMQHKGMRQPAVIDHLTQMALDPIMSGDVTEFHISGSFSIGEEGVEIVGRDCVGGRRCECPQYIGEDITDSDCKEPSCDLTDGGPATHLD